jgi:hypothetical protein
MNAIVLNFDAIHYAETTEALRKAEVSSENKRSDWGRETLTGLFGKHMTEGDLLAALLIAFKPKKPNGKAGDTLSSLRYAKGGDAVRKAATLCIDIVEAATEGQIAEAFRPVAIAFATDAPDAPKSLYALRDEMNRLRREAAKAAKGEPEGETEGETDAETSGETVAAVPLAVMAERMALALREAKADDIVAADDQLTDLLAAIRDAFATSAADEESEAIAA